MLILHFPRPDIQTIQLAVTIKGRHPAKPKYQYPRKRPEK
jgi:hypothetical protein